MKFKDIKPFTKDGNYKVDVPLDFIQEQIQAYIVKYNLDLNPDFQRGHVWSKQQKIKFIEFLLQRGTPPEIRFNCPNWQKWTEKSYNNALMQIVDGKQRLTAIMQFLNDEIPAFGYKYSEYEDQLPISISIAFRVNDLPTRKDVLEWYLQLNEGTVAHTQEELDRVKQLLHALN